MSAIPGWLCALAGIEEEQLARMLRRAPGPVRRRLFEEWFWQAHAGQGEPEGAWRVWLIMAGRGFGKTKAGAEWVLARARGTPGARIALVAPTIEEVAKVMIEGESGLIAAARTGETVHWSPTQGIAALPNDATGFAYSGERPAKLRGPQHHFAWGDEIAQWRHADSAWDNLRLGLRLGERPRAVLTTTPRPAPVLRRIIAAERTALTGGRTHENVHLSADFLDAVTGLYARTRLGRQELDGLLLDEAEGALWSRALIESTRVPPKMMERGRLARVVIGVDPPGSVQGDACGIVAAGLDRAGTGYVLGDHSVAGRTPEGWAAAVAAAAAEWEADLVIAEGNMGGAMVESVLRAADRDLPLRLAHARDNKSARAEPVATLFERGRVRLAGSFPALEDELAGLCAGGVYAGPGRSPDRADAMVWALHELMLKRRRSPSISAI